MEIVFKIRLIPKSSKREIIPEGEGQLRIKVNAPPVNGKANAECIKILSQKFRIAKSKIEITGGEKSRDKLFRIFNINEKEAQTINDFLNTGEKQEKIND